MPLLMWPESIIWLIKRHRLTIREKALAEVLFILEFQIVLIFGI